MCTCATQGGAHFAGVCCKVPACPRLPPNPIDSQVEAHGQQLPPGPGRDMTFEEKRKLSHSMGSLAGERLVHVLQIIADGPSAPVLVSRA